MQLNSSGSVLRRGEMQIRRPGALGLVFAVCSMLLELESSISINLIVLRRVIKLKSLTNGQILLPAALKIAMEPLDECAFGD